MEILPIIFQNFVIDKGGFVCFYINAKNGEMDLKSKILHDFVIIQEMRKFACHFFEVPLLPPLAEGL
ncbi:MAG: hypothetical protein LIP03_15170 [Bacteroidales bacterium]|nr:hypothetical protein [Bacteroidales bacterium]